MNAHKTNLIHALALILISMYAYFDAMNKEMVILLPLMVGIVLLSLNNGILYENKDQIRASLGITIVSLMLLFYKFSYDMRHDDTTFMIFDGVMIFTGLLSLVYLSIKVFGKSK